MSVVLSLKNYKQRSCNQCRVSLQVHFYCANCPKKYIFFIEPSPHLSQLLGGHTLSGFQHFHVAGRWWTRSCVWRIDWSRWWPPWIPCSSGDICVGTGGDVGTSWDIGTGGDVGTSWEWDIGTGGDVGTSWDVGTGVWSQVWDRLYRLIWKCKWPAT